MTHEQLELLLTQTESRANSFAELVRAMREAQKAYFKTKYRDDLIASKKLEERVDKALKDMIDLPMFEE